VVDGYWPVSASKVPFFHCSFGTAAATAAGLKAGLEMIGDRTTTVLAWAGDGGTFDIGFQSLSGAAERNEDILYCCYDNEAYMNTGIQQSSATPYGASTSTTPTGRESRGKTTGSKNMPLVMAMHEIPYVATATLSHLEDYAKKLLAVEPNYYDAYLATGVSSYIIGNLFAPVRWMLRFAGYSGTTEEGIRHLKITAERGRLLAPFARLLLAIASLRANNPAQARELLKGLSEEFPTNPLSLARLH
jgi:hypothetical protein